jgi:hypothetical protein
MTWERLLAIAFMVGINLLIWAILRHYRQRGAILALPKSIECDRTPRWFRFNMALGWASLALSVAFTILVSTVLLQGQ